MALFTNIQEVYEHVAFNLSFEFSDIEPFLEEVEENELVRYVGQDLYDRIKADNNPTDIEAECLKRMRRFVARLATIKWLPLGQVQFGRDGITTVGKSESRTAAYDPQIQQITASLAGLAASSLESLLYWLEKPSALAHLTEYANSPERIEYNKLFIRNATQFSELYPIFESSITFLAMRPTLARIETQTVAPLLGDLYDTLKGDNLNDLQTTLLTTTKYYLALQTVAEVIELEQSIQLSHLGLKLYFGSQYVNAKYFTPPSEAQRLVTMQAAQRRAAAYWAQMGEILNEINGIVPDEDLSTGIVSTDKIVGF